MKAIQMDLNSCEANITSFITVHILFISLNVLEYLEITIN